MSAAPLVLPLVWAMVQTGAEASFSACRKAPHSLKLISPETPPLPRTVRTVAPQMAFYRKYTEALLHRYASMSLEAGRVPSLMGRELFRGDVSHCKVNGFDDVVHFVHDVGNCLKQLSPGRQHLMRRIAIQGYTYPDAAAMLGISLRNVVYQYGAALDQLTSILLEARLLNL